MIFPYDSLNSIDKGDLVKEFGINPDGDWIEEIFHHPVGKILLYSILIYNIIETNKDLLLALEPRIFIDNLYGCGSFGCAFRTSNPAWTAKITTDVKEINFYRFAIANNAKNPFLPKILQIIELETPEYVTNGTRSFLVYREAAIPLSDLKRSTITNGDFLYFYPEFQNHLRRHYNKYIIQPEDFFREIRNGKRKNKEIVKLYSSVYRDALDCHVLISDVKYVNSGVSVADGRLIVVDAQVEKMDIPEDYLQRGVKYHKKCDYVDDFIEEES